MKSLQQQEHNQALETARRTSSSKNGSWVKKLGTRPKSLQSSHMPAKATVKYHVQPNKHLGTIRNLSWIPK